MSGTRQAAGPPAIILHIGRNKAGSTTLQDYFAAHADWLGESGVQYGLFGHLAGTIEGLPSFRSHHELIEAFAARPDRSIVVSNEIIAGFPPEYSTRMAADLAAVGARVIFYVRPYRTWLVSSYAYDVRSGLNGRDFDAYVAHMMPRVSCWPALQIWGGLLGWDRVRVRSTDPRDLIGGDLVEDCLAAIGVSPPGPIERRRSNAAPNWMASELLRMVVGREEARGWDFTGLAIAEALHELADEAVASCGLTGAAAQYPTRTQASALADMYNADLGALRMHTGTGLQPDDASEASERPFLPSAAQVPKRVIQAIAARAAAPHFARMHPEAAAFVSSPAFAALGGRFLVQGERGSYIAGGSPARRDSDHMDAGVTERVADAAQAWALAEQGDLPGAIARGMQAAPDLDLLAAMARWRRDVFTQITHPPGPPNWPPILPDPFPGFVGIPAIPAVELTAEILGGAILHHGSLRVNGLVAPEAVQALREGVDRALAAQVAFNNQQPETDLGWYLPLDVPSLTKARQWSQGCGAVWTADSPPMLREVIAALSQCGVIGHIADLMGERPALSVAKSTLRRVSPTAQHDWHQDGAFLGRNVRSVNVWLALSECGLRAPGMDVVGKRLPYVLQTHSHGAWFDWSVGNGLVDILAEGGAPVETPEFGPGDALLFDHMMLHRTSVKPGMTKDRWAIESWFFAPTDYPFEQVPLLV